MFWPQILYKSAYKRTSGSSVLSDHLYICNSHDDQMAETGGPEAIGVEASVEVTLWIHHFKNIS